MSELKRTLNLVEVVFFAAGVILGAGIYTVIGKAAGQGGNMLWLSFVIAAVIALFSLFAYAELVSMFPESGGEFSFVKHAVNLKWAFVVGTMVTLSGIVSSATISIGFAGYLSELVDVPKRLAAIGIIGFILGVNVLGIRQSSAFNIVFTLLEAAGLGFVIWSAAPAVGEVDLMEAPPGGTVGILTGAALCFFAFTGFEDAVKLAEETKNPERNIPRGLFIAAIVVMCIYLTMAIVVVSMIPFGELENSGSPLSTVVEKRFGRTGALVIAAVALFSTSNSLLSNMLGASRVLLNFGRNSRKLKGLSKVLPGRRTPARGLLVAAALAMLFSLIGKVEKVALITNFFMLLTFLIVNGAVIYLRMKKPHLERPFRIPLNVRNIPVLSIVSMLLVLVLAFFTVYALSTGGAL